MTYLYFSPSTSRIHQQTDTPVSTYLCPHPSTLFSFLDGRADGWRGTAAWKVEAWLIDEVLVPRGSNHVISLYWLTVPIERLLRLCRHVCKLSLAHIQNLLQSDLIWVARSPKSTCWDSCWEVCHNHTADVPNRSHNSLLQFFIILYLF